MDPVTTTAIRRAHAALEVALQPDSISIAEYARACVPLVLAAVLGTTPALAAAALLTVRRERGSYFDSTPRLATRFEDAVLALDIAGVAVEQFDIRTGERTHSATETVALARSPSMPTKTSAERLEEVREFIESMPVNEQARMRARWEELSRGPSEAPLSLRAWVQKPGTWLVVVAGETQHMLALRDRAVIAGDSLGRYSDREIVAALRVVE